MNQPREFDAVLGGQFDEKRKALIAHIDVLHQAYLNELNKTTFYWESGQAFSFGRLCEAVKMFERFYGNTDGIQKEILQKTGNL